MQRANHFVILFAGFLFVVSACLPAPGHQVGQAAETPGGNEKSSGLARIDTPAAQERGSVQSIQIPFRKGKGFIRVGPSKRYFQYEDGIPFVPIGHNEWLGRFTDPPYTSESIDAYLKNMHDHGENVLRILLDSPKPLVEKPAGVFNPEFKRYMDRLVRLAEKNDIYLMVAIWPIVFNVPKAFALGHSWSEHLYNVKNGGHVKKYEDLYTSPEAMKLQEARIRFLVDNWGKSDHIFAWELANEFNFDKNKWIQHVASYCKAYEMSKYGKSHLRCISVSATVFGGPESAQWSCPDLDFATFHTYGKTDFRMAKGRRVGNLVNQTFLVPEIVARVRSKAKDRPLVDSEIPGIIHGARKNVMGLFMKDELMVESFLTVGWAYLCSGAASPGLRWASNPIYRVDGQPNALSMRMYRFQLALRRFADQANWNKLSAIPFTDLQVRTVDKRDLRTLSSGSRDRRYLVGWVFDRFGATEATQATASFSGLSQGGHRIRWFDGTTGKEIKAEQVQGPSFSVATPPFMGHTAFYIEPAN